MTLTKGDSWRLTQDAASLQSGQILVYVLIPEGLYIFIISANSKGKARAQFLMIQLIYASVQYLGQFCQ